MKFAWATLVVQDMEKSIQFYKEVLNLKANKCFTLGPGREFAFLGEGETQLELMTDPELSESNMGRDISLGFEIPSVEKMISDLKEKEIPIHSGPFQPNPNMIFFFIMDPNGLKIQLFENISEN